MNIPYKPTNITWYEWFRLNENEFPEQYINCIKELTIEIKRFSIALDIANKEIEKCDERLYFANELLSSIEKLLDEEPRNTQLKKNIKLEFDNSYYEH